MVPKTGAQRPGQDVGDVKRLCLWFPLRTKKEVLSVDIYSINYKGDRWVISPHKRGKEPDPMSLMVGGWGR